MKRFKFLSRGALVAFAATAWLIASPASLAQTVSVNGTTTNCTVGTTSITQILAGNGAGNITITCTVAGGSVFTCTANANPASIQSGTGAASTIQVINCANGTAAGYSWTIPGTITTTTSQAANQPSFVVTAPAGLTADTPFQFPVTVTPSSGAAWMGTASLTVTAAAVVAGGGGGGTGGSGGSGGSCGSNTVSSSGAWTTAGGRFTVTLAPNQVASYSIPQSLTDTPKYLFTFQTAQVATPGSAQGLGAQIAISSCQGDFSANVPANCSTWNTTDTTFTLSASGGGTPVGWWVHCTLPAGTQYYMNVRMINQSLTAPSCTSGSCSMYLSM